MEVSERFAEIFNQCEAVLWFVIAVGIGCRIRRLAWVNVYWLLPPAFFVFGISDVIESRTGTFWDPWWLLVMKVACVMVFMWVGAHHLRAKAKRRDGGRS